MRTFLMGEHAVGLLRLVVLIWVLSLMTVMPTFAGSLDDYYLAAFGEQSAGASGKTTSLQTETAALPAQCGTPLKHGLQRDWSLLLPTTQKVLAKQLALPTLSGTEFTFISANGHFKIHYTNSGSDAPPLLDNDANGTPDWVETVAATMEYNFAAYTALGYRAAPTINGAPYDVYLRNLAAQGIYGMTTSSQPAPSPGFANAYASYIEIDKDFLNSIYYPYLPLQSLQVTTAHEYQHAIQYGYNFYFDIWYAEATATWFEDELYDDVNQLYNYLPGWLYHSTLSLDTAVDYNATTIGAGYGRWIFNRFLAEQHGAPFVRTAWETLATLDSASGQDIPMAPLLEQLLSASPFNTTLGADFLALAKRFYTRDWTSHGADISKIHLAVPVATYTSYPVSTSSVPAPAVTLPHYSFAYYKFTPVATDYDLSIAVNKSNGISATVFRKSNGIINEIPANPDGATFTVTGFGSLNPASDEIVLLLVNTTATDGLGANFNANLFSLVVAGSCGPANGTTINTIPTSGLCTAGTPSEVSGTGPWQWSCLGINGGTTDSCSASIQSYALSITIDGTGEGAITSDPAAITCTSGLCQASFNYGTTVNLLQVPNAVSTFTAWSGACTGSGSCTITVDGPKSATATFTRAPNAKIGSIGYGTLGAAYAAAATGNTILALDTELAENLTLNLNKTITLKGGYNASFSSISGLPTVLKGSLKITTDRLNVNGLVIKP